MNDPRIHECKDRINHNDLFGLKENLQRYLIDDAEPPDWTVLFYRVYLHACLRGRAEIAEWLEKEVYPLLDTQAQLYLRQTFAYGRHLLRRSIRV